MNKHGLGKGLGALIRENDQNERASHNRIEDY